MQLKVIIGALAIFLAPIAFAQPKPTYFLVDVSGSMKDGHRKEAEELLKREVSSLVSITYFGGKPTSAERPGACGEGTSVSPPAPPGAILPPLPELGGGDGSTGIGTALRAALAAAHEDATIVLITDGKEECLADFKTIRSEYPKATIKVLQVGSNPNTPLQLLELKPHQDLSAPEVSPEAPEQGDTLPKLETKEEDTGSPENSSALDEWWADAGWPGKYLWLLAYLPVGVAAGILGASFGKMTVTVEQAIRNLEDNRRKSLEAKDATPNNFDHDFPEELNFENVSQVVRNDRFFVWLSLTIAVTLGAPLALFDGVDQVLAKGLVTAFAAAVFVGAIYWFRREKGRPATTADPNDRPATEIHLVIWAAILIASLTWIWLADLDVLRRAAWVPLSSNFSAALAVVASAPLLFVGAKRWSFDRAKFTYFGNYNSAMSDALRKKREQERQRQRDWENNRSELAKLMFPQATLVGRFWSALKVSALERNRAIVFQEAKRIAINAGGPNPSDDANNLFENLRASDSLIAFFRTLNVKGLLKDNNQLWLDLIAAMEGKAKGDGKGKADRNIADAFSRLASVLRSKTGSAPTPPDPQPAPPSAR